MIQKRRVAVVGGGPGGLTLARILHVHGVDVTVLERERSGSARPQGGSLDMHADSGQYAIACAGLTAEFRRIARYEDQETRVYDKHGTLLHLDEDVIGRDRPEVDRGHLRQMLLNSLPTGMVRWDHELISAALVDGGCELTFRDGTKERFDLVVGADGTWSRVRPLLSAARPVYSGVMFVELGIDDADRRFPELARLIGRGLAFALGDAKAIIGHRDADAHLGIYVAMRVAEDWPENGGLDWTSGAAVKQSLGQYFEGWSAELRELIYRAGEGGERIAPRPIYALPVGHRWESTPGVTLLGDAAHVMSPFGGDGANLAMQDGADLALALTGSEDWRGAVCEFEAKMFARAEEAAGFARAAIDEVFSEDGLAHTLRTMQEHGRRADDMPAAQDGAATTQDGARRM